MRHFGRLSLDRFAILLQHAEGGVGYIYLGGITVMFNLPKPFRVERDEPAQYAELPFMREVRTRESAEARDHALGEFQDEWNGNMVNLPKQDAIYRRGWADAEAWTRTKLGYEA